MKRGHSMKLKLLAVSLALAAFGANAQVIVHPHQQNVRLATVISAEPIQHREVVSVPRQVCGVYTQPVYNTQPVYGTYRDPNSPAPIVGMLVGAVAGYHAMGSAPGLGALLGGTVGYSIGDHVRSSHPYWTGQQVTTVTNYNRTYCQTQYETMEVMKNLGFRVTYEIDGVQSTVVMRSHPGSHVRLITNVVP
jgi:uncharacterized protein YcfJ